MKRNYFFVILFVTSLFIYSCDDKEKVEIKEENQGELLLKDKFGIADFTTESIDLTAIEGIEFSSVKSKSDELIDVATYNNGNKTYTISIGEDSYLIVYVNSENKLIKQKEFTIEYTKDEPSNINFNDGTLKFYREEGESYGDCCMRALEDVRSTFWGEVSFCSGGAPAIAAACMVSCI
jgi:hypothetical protein